MKARVEMFCFTHQFVQPGGRAVGDSVPECRHHLAKWIVEASAAFDAAQGLNAPPILPGDGEAAIKDLAIFLDRAKAPRRARAAIVADIVAVGAADVQELFQADWESLPSWALLKPLERRRVLAMVPPCSS